MKKIVVIFLSFLTTPLLFATSPEMILRKGQKEVILESGVLSLVDGSFINADTIELMRKCQRQYLIKLVGQKNADGTRKGLYLFEGNYYSIHELVAIEKERGLTPTLQACLKHAKDNFIKTSNEFRMVAAGSKPIYCRTHERIITQARQIKKQTVIMGSSSRKPRRFNFI